MSARRSPGPFWRLCGYLRPYLPILLAALLCGGAYAGARTLRAWLVQPLLDDVLIARPEPAPTSSTWMARVLGLDPTPAAPTAGDEGSESDGATGLRAPGGVDERLGRLLVAALALVLIIPVAHFGRLYLTQLALGRALVDLQSELCTKLLALPLSFHQRARRGDTLSRTLGDAVRAHAVLELCFGRLAQSVLAMSVGLVILFSISWQLTLLTGVMAPILAGILAAFGRRIRRSARRRQESLGSMTQRLVEILSGIEVIKAFRAQQSESAAFQRENQRFLRRNLRVVLNRAAARSLVEGVNNALGIAVLLLGAVAVLNGTWGLTPGSLGAFVMVMFTAYRPIREVAKAWTQLQDAAPSAERFFALLGEEEEPGDPPDARDFEGVRSGIRFRDVVFSYGREPVLRGVSLDVAAGQVVAIVGRTGAGKTTLMDLLLRFHEPHSGCIEIDGVDLRRIRRASLLDRVAVVTQEPRLFAGSIRDNIRFGRPAAGDAEVEEAARAAHVLEFSALLPEGLDTPVGEAGVQLSGGQRQRITIARALLRDPEILVFDEATSALDAKSERAVQQAIQSLVAGRTVFVVAHRLSTVRRADRLVVLERGRVVAAGTHAELMAEGGLYRELVELQAEGDVG